jgi:serine/threonine protein kinase
MSSIFDHCKKLALEDAVDALRQEAVIEEEIDDLSGDELPPGTVLFHGQYTITRYLNSGGFGITYLAKDSLDRDVVIKECFAAAFCRRNHSRVSARTTGGKESLSKILRSFVKEARNLSRLIHPNIVGVHQVFEDNDTAYMALDYLTGDDLQNIISNATRKLEPDTIQRITVKLVSAIKYIHDSGMLHGDIAPDNILLNQEGEPIIIDFGAARKSIADANVGFSGLTVVKDGYSPHEAYLPGGKSGPWSDLYSLAASMYHAITGAVPVSSQGRLAAIAETRLDPCPPLSGNADGYQPGFLECLDKAMSVMPASRFQSADEWLDGLRGLIGYEDSNMKLLGKSPRASGPNRTDKRQQNAVKAGVAPEPQPTLILKGKNMAADVSGLKEIGGFIAGCLVDAESGLMVASEIVGNFDIETAAAANVEVVRAKQNAMSILGLKDHIEDILISLGGQLHLIRPLEKAPTMFIYCALDRKTANLGLARAQVKKVEQAIKI